MKKIVLALTFVLVGSFMLAGCSKDEILNHYNNIVQSAGAIELTGKLSLKGTKEKGPQGRSSRASVLQEITGPTNQFKNAQKARNHAVFRAFSFPKSLLSFVWFWQDLTSPDPVFLD